jgi:hypothetical protein
MVRDNPYRQTVIRDLQPEVGLLIAKVIGIYHGSCEPGGDPASLIGFQFLFGTLGLESEVRIKRASISSVFTYEDEPPGGIAPEVVSWEPSGPIRQYRSGSKSRIAAGVGVEVGEAMEYAGLIASEPVLSGRSIVERNGAKWVLWENEAYKSGIPSELHVAILLKRIKQESRFHGTVTVKVETSGGSWRRKFSSIRSKREPDRIIFDPKKELEGRWENIDRANLGEAFAKISVDLRKLLKASPMLEDSPATTSAPKPPRSPDETTRLLSRAVPKVAIERRGSDSFLVRTRGVSIERIVSFAKR